MNPDIDVIIVTYRSLDHLPFAAATIRASSRIKSVVVVDNNSGDRTVTVARGLDWGVPCVAVEAGSNLGFGAGINLGVRSAPRPSPYLLLLNPDASISAEGIDRLRARLEAAPDMACVGAQLRLTDGSPVSSARRFPDPRSMAMRRFMNVDHCGRLSDADWVCGALMLWRRPAFVELGGFSSDYFLYYEDMDICRRARLKGWSVAIDGSVDAVHDQGHGRPTSAALQRVSRASRRTYARRWMGGAGVAASAVADLMDGLATVRRGVVAGR